MSMGLGIALAEHGAVPVPLERQAIRRLLRQRIADIAHIDQDDLIDELRNSPIARATDKANEQHYEVPARFFELVLGPHRKYSCCYWPRGVNTLAEAERASLDQVCERARLEDGQRILELGCGWGAFSLYAAHKYPNASLVAVSNSRSQAAAIEACRPPNIEVITADINDFRPNGTFDRIVSIEMLEHVRNYESLFARVAQWLAAEGRFFVHVFCHRDRAYPFETNGTANWMGRHFFTGGLMPSVNLFRAFDDALGIETQWPVNGTHYARTARAWRKNLARERDQVIDLLRDVYGDQAHRWYHRWRLFFLACEELFAFDHGLEWLVAHYRFAHHGASRLSA
jgi:cyclopropane-fatty-acyl-phospholipid synthase